MPQASDIRIVKNTVIIYIRMAVTIVVGLITSRLVLQALGASDVGIYSAVGSAVALVGVITSALSGTTIRFMNFELGKANGNPNRMFNICHIIHLGGAAVILLILETVGIWYIKTKLNVPLGKEADAMFVFQVSTVVACLGIANVPFQSLFTVHEKFATVALVDIVNTLVKLGLVAALFFMRGRPDCLRIYAVMMSVTTWISFIAYHIMSARRWPQIVRWKPVREKSAYKEVLTFSNYTLLSSSAIIARSQGSNMLINAFFGTTTNAAFFYANTLQNYVVQFVNNFDSASAPQITQNVGAGQVDKAIKLARRSCRICLLLFLLLFFPLWSELPFLMGLWLGSNMPPETVEMARWTLLIAAVATTSAGLGQLINAFGRIKWYKIEFTVLFLLCLPAGYILFKNGAPAYTILATFAVADFLNRIIQFILLRFQFHFPVGNFLRHAYLRPIVISFLMTGYLLLYESTVWICFWGHVSGFFLTLFVSVAAIGYIGFTKEERKKGYYFILRRIPFLKDYYQHLRRKDKILESVRLKELTTEEQKAYIGRLYYEHLEHPIDWNNLRTYTEKMQWEKLLHKDPLKTRLSDKYLVREWVKDKIGEEYLIPLLGVWDRFDDINFDLLPKSFVLKTNHASGTLIIVKDKDSFSKRKARRCFNDWMQMDFAYQNGFEMHYSDIERKIIAEQYMETSLGELPDYKFLCFNGVPYYCWVDNGRFSNHTRTIFDMNWEQQEWKIGLYSNYTKPIEKPLNFDLMVSLAKTLSAGFQHVRVDFYNINGKVFFGEMTFTSVSGFEPFIPEEYDLVLGNLWDIDQI